jgi:hypothetical protein
MGGAPSGGGGGTHTPSWQPSGGRPPGPVGQSVAAAHVIRQTRGPSFGSARHAHPTAPGGQRLVQSASAPQGGGRGGGHRGGGSAHTPSWHAAGGASGGAPGGAWQSVAARHFIMQTRGPSFGSARQVHPSAPAGQPFAQSASPTQGGGSGGPGGRDGRHAPSRQTRGGTPAPRGQSESAAHVDRHTWRPPRPAKHAQPAEPDGQALVQSASALHGGGPPPGGSPGGGPHGGSGGAGSAAGAASCCVAVTVAVVVDVLLWSQPTSSSTIPRVSSAAIASFVRVRAILTSSTLPMS